MIIDYNAYQLSRREQLIFLGTGYLCIAFIIFLFYRSLILALIAGVLVRRCQPLYEKYLARKRLQELNLQFRDLLDALSASVTAGRQMGDALVEACDQLALMHGPQTPIMMELRSMKRRIVENHESDRDLLADFAARAGSEDIRSFVQVYLTCRSTGGDLARIIAHSAEIITEKMKINEQIQTITAQKKFEGRIISLMPVVMLLGLNLVSASYVGILYTSLAGRFIMTLCLAGTVVGVCMMERMSNVEV